ncbi:hypothetical protein C4Z12_009495, partial [Klebsiella pneumoniae subsp. pneumoniae]
GTVCVVGKMRDLILQLSKSSIYSTKPLQLSKSSIYSTKPPIPSSIVLRRKYITPQDACINRSNIGLAAKCHR